MASRRYLLPLRCAVRIEPARLVRISVVTTKRDFGVQTSTCPIIQCTPTPISTTFSADIPPKAPPQGRFLQGLIVKNENMGRAVGHRGGADIAAMTTREEIKRRYTAVAPGFCPHEPAR